MVDTYEAYKQEIVDDLSACLEGMGVQPILFVGSGLSQRYFSAPTWEGLLKELARTCPTIDKDYLYYKQKHNSLIDIGSEFAQLHMEWAWGDGKPAFPDSLFKEPNSPNIYIKHRAAEIINNALTSEKALAQIKEFDAEIESLKKIRPHAIITTNYDNFLEEKFEDYTPIIGQSILKENYSNIGEILKIHGCASKPETLILTAPDYVEFQEKKKYLSAKLLTYFIEHPLIFIGYSAEDPNIRAILSDIDEIISSDKQLIPNIFIIDWTPEIHPQASYQKEKLIQTSPEKSIRIKSILASDFNWIFEALQASEALSTVNIKLLRSLMARTYDLVRHDIPKRTIEIDFQTLEHAIADQNSLAKIYGITTLDDPTKLNAAYPFSLSRVGELLGFNGWHGADQLIKQLKQATGFDMKTSDNKYHLALKAGKVMEVHKYSQAAIDILEKLNKGETYDLSP